MGQGSSTVVRLFSFNMSRSFCSHFFPDAYRFANDCCVRFAGISLVVDLTKNTYFCRKLLIMSEIRNRITINPEICHGKPCIRGMRWPVEVIIDMLGSGMTTEEILSDHPELEKEDILASLNFAKLYLSGHSIKDVA
jgi:uncharacterized protein (DUF433 family)